jgi:hypothetical protein
MQSKGEEIGTVPFTTRRLERKENNVGNQVPIGDLDIEKGERVFVEFYREKQNGSEFLDSYETSVYNSQKAISLRKETVVDNDLLPGMKCKVKIFEVSYDEAFVDDATVIDRVNAVADKSCSDGVDSRLYSQSAYEYLKDGSKPIKFRNVRTKSEYVFATHANESNNVISFPKTVRDKISAKDGDLIELIRPKTTSEQPNGDVEEQIREMHEAIMAMYNDYLDEKDE